MTQRIPGLVRPEAPESRDKFEAAYARWDRNERNREARMIEVKTYNAELSAQARARRPLH